MMSRIYIKAFIKVFFELLKINFPKENLKYHIAYDNACKKNTV